MISKTLGAAAILLGAFGSVSAQLTDTVLQKGLGSGNGCSDAVIASRYGGTNFGTAPNFEVGNELCTT